MSELKPAVNSADHHQGNVYSPIVLVEYGDYECPYCGRAYPIIKRLLEEKGDEFQFIFRNFPLRQIHPYAYASALAAEAAAKQGKFWEMHDLIFENQKKLNPEFLQSLSGRLDLDYDQFIRDSASQGVQDKIETDFDSGIHSGVNGTPSFFMNGKRLMTYDETYESLLDAILMDSPIAKH